MHDVKNSPRTMEPGLKALIDELAAAFEPRRQSLLRQREEHRARLADGDVGFLDATVHMRSGTWKVAPLPDALAERRVELIGGATRQELVQGMNAGAKSYIADLWNFSKGDTESIRRAHRHIERAAVSDLVYIGPDGDRMRIAPANATRLMVVPRPLPVFDTSLAIAAGLYDLTLLVHRSGSHLTDRQGGVYLYLRDVQGHLEARWWNDLFDRLEQHIQCPRGTIRATVMIDSIPGALEAEEILFELLQHAAGLSFDPQGYSADHIALFHGPDRLVLPDRERIGLNTTFLRTLSLHTIGICHRRGCHAIGAPSFVLPPKDPARMKAEYLEMLADKEREAVDGHDGTIVVHSDTVNGAMVEFNKSMPRAHQIDYLRTETIAPADLIRRPEGEITVDSLVGMVRTAFRTLVDRDTGVSWVIQGGRLHDRSSLRLALRLLWQWNKSEHGVITSSGLEVHDDLLKYLVRKEGDKMFGASDERTRKAAASAANVILELVTGESVPFEPEA